MVRTELIQKSGKLINKKIWNRKIIWLCYIYIGSLFRNRVKFEEYLNRRLTFNPRRGIKHFRAPSRVFWKTVRGMLSYKTKRGAAALGILIIIK